MNNSYAFLISNPYNIFYIAGFVSLSPHEREAYVLVINSKNIIITDSRYEGEHHNSKSELYILKQGERALEAVAALCKKYNIQNIKFESDDLKWSEVQQLNKLDVNVTPTDSKIENQRSTKTEEEIFAVKQACHIGDLVLKEITPYLHPTQTEKEIAWILEKMIREAFNAELAFDPIVAVDAHAAMPHYNTKKGDGVIKENSILLIDFGVKMHSYCSDITRMISFGEQNPEVEKTYALLLSAQKKTLEFAHTARQLKEIDFFTRSELKKNGLPNYTHSTGHGIGLEVHESPRISFVSQDEKLPGQVFTIEPGVFYPDKWGMRIEDTVTVLDQGELQVLTRFPKELIHL